MAIHLDHLTKRFGDQIAVDGLSFTAPDNEIVGFLGPNGAGKSTTMKMITGFLSPNEGTVSINGIDVQAQPIIAKRKVGYLPEGNPLYYEMYVREYLSFVAEVHHIKNASKRINQMLETVGLMPESNKKIGQLSKGYKQRVGLAAAIIHDPEVLILDEATSGLDPNQIIEIRQLIKDLGKNRTVLFSSHILQEVESICDRIVIIHNGKLVANDTLANLQSNHQSDAVVVRFSVMPNANELKKLPSVIAVENIHDAWILSTESPNELKKMLLEYSLKNNIDILSLQTKSNSLEEVFSKLTKT